MTMIAVKNFKSLARRTAFVVGGLSLVFHVSAIATADESVEFRTAGKCLDADSNRNGANGTNVQLWECNGGLHQKWKIKGSRIESVAYPGMFLDVDSNRNGANGSNVQLWEDNSGWNQRWTLDGSKVRSVAYPDKLLDIDANFDAMNGSNAHLWDDLNTANQMFQIR